MKYFWLFSLLLLFSLAFVCKAFDLVLMHTNDVHAHFVEFNEFGGRCPPKYRDEGKCFGGFARQATKANEIRANNPNVVFLNGGDFFQGTVWYTLYKYKAVAEFVNKLSIDAMSLGNHEFDDGLKDLIPYLKALKTEVIVCNIDASQEPEFQELVKPSTVLEIGGEKIGVIGYLTPETKFLSSTGKLEFFDEVECIQKEAKRLSDEGINKIIAVGHSGIVVDTEIAKNVPEVDIVVGGHTNTFLYTGTPPSVETPYQAYPMEIKREGGSRALVVQDFAFGKYLGYLEVSFTEDGQIDHYKGNPILLNSSVEQDPEVLELLKPYSKEVETRGKQEIGRTNVLLQGDRQVCRMKECNLGNYLADAALDYFISAPTEKGWSNVAVAVWNSGGIRGSVDERINNGSVILEDILTIAPFGNTMDIVGLKGKHLVEVLEASVKDYELEPLDPPGSFLQVSGLRVTYNVLKPPGSRVLNVKVRCTDCRIPEFKPLEEEEVYEVVIPTYLAQGGDAFSMIPEHTQGNRNTDELDLDIITAYMKKIKPIIHGLEDRITVLSEEASHSTLNPQSLSAIPDGLGNQQSLPSIPDGLGNQQFLPSIPDGLGNQTDVADNVRKLVPNVMPEKKEISETKETTLPASNPEITTSSEAAAPTVNTPFPDIMKGTRERLDKAREDIQEGFKNFRESSTKVLKDATKRFPGPLGGGIFKLR